MAGPSAHIVYGPVLLLKGNMQALDDDGKIAMGEFCEILLRSDQFAYLTKSFEEGTVGLLLSTSPLDKETREQAYHAVRGVNDFLQSMAAFVAEKNRLTITETEPSDTSSDVLEEE